MKSAEVQKAVRAVLKAAGYTPARFHARSHKRAPGFRTYNGDARGSALVYHVFDTEPRRDAMLAMYALVLKDAGLAVTLDMRPRTEHTGPMIALVVRPAA